MAIGLGLGPCKHGVIDNLCFHCHVPVCIVHAPHLGRDLRHLLARLPHAQIITGQRTERGEDGCLAGHKAAIGVAIEREWDRVLVVEDDCLLTPAFEAEALASAGRWAETYGYDTIFGGSVLTHNARVAQLESGRALLAVDKCCSAHFVLHLRAGYAVALRCQQPYDLQLGEQGAKCLLTWPFMAIQRAGLSGIGLPLDAGSSQRYAGPQVVNYEGMFAAHARAIQEALLL